MHRRNNRHEGSPAGLKVFPRKRFGQHFLKDGIVIQQIINVLNLTPNKHFIEIGPGTGALTFPVLKQLHKLEVIELDQNLIPQLKQQADILGEELIIYGQDVLSLDFAQLKNDARPLHIFGNLPYNISTPLLFHLLKYTNMIEEMVVMLQKEVANRLTAMQGCGDYGRLSVMIQYHCQVEQLFDVSANAFHPPPKVNSSIVRLVPCRQYKADNEALFASIVRQAFSQRRKTLRNSLQNVINHQMWPMLNISPQLRAENLSIQDFVNLSNQVNAM